MSLNGISETEVLNLRAEKYIRKCEKYTLLMETLEKNFVSEKRQLATAQQQQREELNSTLTNATLYEQYLRRADKSSSDVKEKLDELQSQNRALRTKINQLREDNNLAIQQIERNATTYKVCNEKKKVPVELTKNFNDKREKVENDMKRLQQKEREAHHDFTVSLELARQLHQQKAAEEGKRLTDIRRKRKKYRRGNFNVDKIKVSVPQTTGPTTQSVSTVHVHVLVKVVSSPRTFCYSGAAETRG